MSAEDRRAMIVHAVLPLLIEHGANVTSSQIARAAGIGEGTIFRAFKDKDELFDACTAEALRPDHVLDAIAEIPVGQPLEDRLVEAAEALGAHLERMGALMGALHASGRVKHRDPEQRLKDRAPGRAGAASRWPPSAGRWSSCSTPEKDRLRLPPEQLAALFLTLLFGGRRLALGRRRAHHAPGGRLLPARRRGGWMIPGGGGGMEFMLGRRGRRRHATTVPESGLTGPVDIPEPKPDDQPKDLRSRLKRAKTSVAGTVRGLPKVAKLTWQASPILTILLALITLLSGLLPTATAYIAKLLLDSVVAAIQHTGTTGDIAKVAMLQFGVLAATAISSALTSIAQSLLQERMTLTIRHQVMAHASELHLAYFEGSTSYDMLRQAAQEAPTRPLSMMNSALGLLRTLITFGSMIALLVSISPLLALVALLGADPGVHLAVEVRLARVLADLHDVADQAADGLSVLFGHDGHLRQGDEAVRARPVLRRPVPPARHRLLRAAAEADGQPQHQLDVLGAAQHARGFGDHAVHRAGGGRRAAHPGRPRAVHGRGGVRADVGVRAVHGVSPGCTRTTSTWTRSTGSWTRSRRSRRRATPRPHAVHSGGSHRVRAR